jgi:glycosyltransferase involved in cell wall biosynthesis
LRLADKIVGISDHTLDTFLAGRSRRSGQDTVLYYGVDPSPFQSARADRAAFRRDLGLAADARLVLFVGRLVPEKNPLFAVDVIAQMHRVDPSVAGIFVGSGSLDEPVRQRIATLGLDRAFRHLGWRNEVAEIMCCCDWFVLPRPERPMEGFGIAVVEAQLAGLELLLSMGIADDPLLSTAAYRRLPLSAGPEAWAGQAMDLARGDPPSRACALDAHSHSPMAMNAALVALLALHQ